MKVLGIDFGTKRIGLAIGDEELKIVVPKGVIKNNSQTLKKIKEIVKEYSIGKIVIGLPLTPSGKEGQRAKLVREFSQKLKEELEDVEIIFWDERYTTEEANRRLEHLPPKKRKEVIDSLSAQIILEEYLDNI